MAASCVPRLKSVLLQKRKTMSENLIVSSGSKEEKYKNLLSQVKALVDAESDAIANMANVAAAIKETFNFLWVGFYRVKGKQLVLGPFQGPLACTRIELGRGVCGYAWDKEETVIVPDVEKFPGHIACSSRYKSEMVVPIFREGKVVGVLDIDSDQLETFDETDAEWLVKIASLIKI